MCEICHKNPHDSRCPNAPEPKQICCQNCDGEPERFYVDKKTGEIVGCDLCLYTLEWWQLNWGGKDNAEI